MKPRFLRSLLIASDMVVFVGSCISFVNLFFMGLPSTNPQMYLSNEPNSSLTSRNLAALFIVDSLELVSYYPRVFHKHVRISFTEPCHFLWVKSGKEFYVILAFFEYRQPSKSCLRSLQGKELKKAAVIVQGCPPLLIMVLHHGGIGRPGTSLHDSDYTATLLTVGRGAP